MSVTLGCPNSMFTTVNVVNRGQGAHWKLPRGCAPVAATSAVADGWSPATSKYGGVHGRWVKSPTRGHLARRMACSNMPSTACRTVVVTEAEVAEVDGYDDGE